MSDPFVFSDLLDLAASSERFGLIWSGGSPDLNANLLLFSNGTGVETHVNNAVDVMLFGIMGNGTVTIDGFDVSLAAGQLLIVPRGATRRILSKSSRFAYLTCHQRREGLWPSPR